MKQFILVFLSLAFFNIASGQKGQKEYEKGLEKAQAGNLEEAITLFSKAIELQPDDYFAWYNRGIAKSMLNRYEDALLDFDQTIKLSPDYKKAYLNRGTTKKYLTDYPGAMSDFNYSLKLDKNYEDAYYNRGVLYDLLGKKDSACKDFNAAASLGMKMAQKKVSKCKDTTRAVIPVNAILRLTKTAKDESYGFTAENPIKAGTGPEGGPANQRFYIELLRDAKGMPLKYTRKSSCCPYKSDYGMFGMGMLDQYEIVYLNKKGKEKKKVIYISFYDYEEPQILFGFQTVGQK